MFPFSLPESNQKRKPGGPITRTMRYQAELMDQPLYS